MTRDHARNRDWLPDLLREWSTWMISIEGAGYPDSSPIWRARYGPGTRYGPDTGGFHSSIPAGVDRYRIHGDLRRLVEAMDRLLADPDLEISKPVRAVQAVYLLGPVAARMAWEVGAETLRGYLRTGEALIRREMRHD